jgi:hypothetical protein
MAICCWVSSHRTASGAIVPAGEMACVDLGEDVIVRVPSYSAFARSAPPIGAARWPQLARCRPVADRRRVDATKGRQRATSRSRGLPLADGRVGNGLVAGPASTATIAGARNAPLSAQRTKGRADAPLVRLLQRARHLGQRHTPRPANDILHPREQVPTAGGPCTGPRRSRLRLDSDSVSALAKTLANELEDGVIGKGTNIGGKRCDKTHGAAHRASSYVPSSILQLLDPRSGPALLVSPGRASVRWMPCWWRSSDSWRRSTF